MAARKLRQCLATYDNSVITTSTQVFDITTVTWYARYTCLDTGVYSLFLLLASQSSFDPDKSKSVKRELDMLSAALPLMSNFA